MYNQAKPFSYDKSGATPLKLIPKIDFPVEANGRVITNDGCNDLKIEYDFPLDFCEIVNISATKVSSDPFCCIYNVTVEINACEDNEAVFDKLLKKMVFKSFNMPPKPITDIDYVWVSSNTLQFSHSVCHPIPVGASVISIAFNDSHYACETEPLELDHCSFDCPPQELMQSWVEITIEPDAEPCEEGQCKISGKFTIPSVYDCYTHYSVSPALETKWQRTSGDSIFNYQSSAYGCLEQGEYRLDTIKLFRSPTDNEPCVIIKPIFCPVEQNITACTPDCEEVEWQTKDSLKFELPDCPQCSVKVYYTHRENTCYVPLKQDIQILSFTTFNDPADSTACSSCSMTPNEIHNISLLKIIYENQMGFLPLASSDTGDCYTSWRVIQAACWVSHYDIFTGGTIWRPCDSVDCCAIGLKVCRFTDLPNPDYITTGTIGGLEGDENCTSFTQSVIDWSSFGIPIFHPDGSISYYQFIELDCEDKCSWLYGLNNEGFYGRHRVEFNNESRSFYGTDEIIIKIAVLENEIAIEVNSEISSNDFSLSVSSLHGIELISKKSKLSKGINYYRIDSHQLNTGLYILNLRLNNMNLRSEKLIIIK